MKTTVVGKVVYQSFHEQAAPVPQPTKPPPLPAVVASKPLPTSPQP